LCATVMPGRTGDYKSGVTSPQNVGFKPFIGIPIILTCGKCHVSVIA
jgi:hypothetical protein